MSSCTIIGKVEISHRHAMFIVTKVIDFDIKPYKSNVILEPLKLNAASRPCND